MYLCIVFFMVLDLRLIEDWVVVRQPFFFLNKSCNAPKLSTAFGKSGLIG